MDEMELVGRLGEVEALPAGAVEHAERVLRAAMRAAETSAPPTPGTRRRRSSRRLLIGMAAATVVVAAAGSVVLVHGGQGANPPGRGAAASRPGPASVPTDVRARVLDALSADTNTVLFVQEMMTTPGEATITSQAWYYPWNGRPGVVRNAGSSWVDGDPAGKVEWDQTFTIPAGDSADPGCKWAALPGRRVVMRSPVKATGITVDFSNDTWQPTEQSCVEFAPGLDAPAGLSAPSGSGPVFDIRTMIEDGLLRVVGHQTINGQPVIGFRSVTHGILTLALWVDASTYLPVQAVTTGPTGDPNPGKTWTEFGHYEFLSPTPAILAHLRVIIPRGFTKAPPSSAQG
jgi:hypothetical protein